MYCVICVTLCLVSSVGVCLVSSVGLCLVSSVELCVLCHLWESVYCVICVLRHLCKSLVLQEKEGQMVDLSGGLTVTSLSANSNFE